MIIEPSIPGTFLIGMEIILHYAAQVVIAILTDRADAFVVVLAVP
jgi:hypothetical protein